MRLAVFASGSGTNFEAIAQACIKGDIPASVEILICDKPHAYVIERAKKLIFAPLSLILRIIKKEVNMRAKL